MTNFLFRLREWLTCGLRQHGSWVTGAHFKWKIISPRSGPLHRGGKTVFIQGQIAVEDPQWTPVGISAARPRKKTFEGIVARTDEPGVFDFSLRFTSSSGLKFYRIVAHFQNGSSRLLGYRLFWCGHVSEYRTPNLFLAQSTPDATEIKLPPAAPDPEVSIIIPIFNQAEVTLKCLWAIARNTSGISYEVIVIDDCSTETTVQKLPAVEHLKVMRNTSNQGFVLNCNRGAAVATGRYLMFLNNDTEVQPRWLEHLLRTFSLRPDAGLVGAKLIYPNGRLQEAGGIIWSDGSAWNFGKDDHVDRPEYNYLKEADYCSGACIAITREFFHQIGGFDTQYVPAYYEDTDLAFQVRAHGRKVYFQPASLVVHHEGVSSGTCTRSGIKRYQVVNAGKFAKTWERELQAGQLPRETDFFHARDRTRHRPCVLVIDHAVPRFDRDAGSRSIFQYLQLLVSSGANVKFISDHFEADVSYAGHLQSMGIETICGPEFDLAGVHAWIVCHAEHFDFVLLSRPYVADRYVDTLRRHTQAKILYLGHDIHHLREKMEFRVADTPNIFWQKTRDLEKRIWDSVDAIYYFTEEECAYVAAQSKVPVRCIPLFMLPANAEAAALEDDETDGLLFVAGFAHRPNQDALLWFLQEIFPLVRAAVPEAHIHVCGSSIPDNLKQYASDAVHFHADISDGELEQAYQRARVCVVPLRYGAGMKGKVLEALFRNKPLVTTSVGAQGLSDAAGCFGVHDAAAAFAQAVVRYYNDARARREAARATREYTARRFSRDAALEVLSRDMPFLSARAGKTRPQSSPNAARAG